MNCLIISGLVENNRNGQKSFPRFRVYTESKVGLSCEKLMYSAFCCCNSKP